MGEAIEKLSGKLGVDTTDFKTGIAAANRELRLLESGFRASTASLGDWSKSATGMEERIKSLTSQIDVQKLKVAALRENYEKIRDEQGENSRAAKEAEIALNKQTETLGKMEGELTTSEQALQELSAAENEAGLSADEAGGKVEEMGSAIDSIGPIVKGTLGVIAGLATAVGAVAVAIGGLVFNTASASADLVDLSAKTGITTERLQEMAYVGEQVGTSQETITSSMSRLIRTMDSAINQRKDFAEASQEHADALVEAEKAYSKAVSTYGEGSEQAESALEKLNDAQEKFTELQQGDVAQAFTTLGVSLRDEAGNLKDNEQVFSEVIEALGKIPNEAERDALSMSIFGKSAQELNPLIKAGSAELERLAEQAHEVGAVMSEEDVAAFEAFDDTLASLKMGLQGTLGTLAGAFLPGFQMVFDQAGGYLREFADIVKTSDGDFGALADGLGGLLTKIIGDVASQAPQMLEAGLGILQSIIDSILSNMDTLIPAALGILENLLNFIILNLPTILTAAIEIIVALANGISQALPTLIPSIVEVILKVVEILLANLPLLIDAALQLILALAQGLIAALPILIPQIPIIVQAIFDALIASLPLIISAALELVNALALGILQNIPLLLTAAVELIGVIVTYLYNDGPKMLLDIGKRLVEGMWQGIKNNIGWLKDNFVREMMGVVDAIKNAMGISSPAEYLEDEVGAWMPPGIGKGFDKALPAVRQHLVRSMIGLANDVSHAAAPQMGATGMGGVGGGSSISIGDIIINIPGTTATPHQVAVAVQDGVLKAMRAKGGA